MNLFEYQDLKFKEFNDKIINDKDYPTIGIRIPILRKKAHEMAKNGQIDYIGSKHTYYEEYILEGLMIGYLKIPFKDTLNLLDKYIPYMKDWSMVDIPASNLKCFIKNKKEGFKYILDLLKKGSFQTRLGYILLLDYYIDDEYVDKIIKLIKNTDDYYIMMGEAWLLATIYIKYPIKVTDILKKNILDNELHNKVISKICESNRVDKCSKEAIKKFKRYILK